MATWDELAPDEQAKVAQAMRIAAQAAGVSVSGPVTVSAEGEELEIPDSAV